MRGGESERESFSQMRAIARERNGLGMGQGLGKVRLEAKGAVGYMTPPNRLAMVAETKPEGSQAALGGA